MDCGAEDIACQVMALIAENELASTTIIKLVAEAPVAGALGVLVGVLKVHGDKLVAAAAFSFGIWKWWRYREQILHKRLFEYLRESDNRLDGGMRYILSAMQRPTPGQAPKLPLFVGTQLRSILRERRWDNAILALTVERSADAQLSAAAASVNKKLETALDALASLRKQHGTINILRGAIAASDAGGNRGFDAEALAFFQAAQGSLGAEADVLVNDLIGRQYRKLGCEELALEAFQAAEECAQSMSPGRERDLTVACAKKCQAEVHQAAANAIGQGSALARNLLSSNTDSALNLRKQYAPFQGWDQLEQADLHFLTAITASKLANHHNLEQSNFAAARAAYQSVLSEKGRWGWRWRSASRKLDMQARRGLDRVLAAEAGGEYE